jgi:hypothetical protein
MADPVHVTFASLCAARHANGGITAGCDLTSVTHVGAQPSLHVPSGRCYTASERLE